MDKKVVYKRGYMELVQCEDGMYQIWWSGNLAFLISREALIELGLIVLKLESEG